MATIKVFDCNGVKDIKCFETLAAVPYLVEEEEQIDDTPEEKNPFE